MLQSHKLSELANRLFTTFGYNHPIVKDTANDDKLLAAPRTSNMGSTERWLFKQVLPASKKLIDNGQYEIVDIFLTRMYDYLNAYLISKDNDYGTANLLADIREDATQNLPVYRPLSNYNHSRNDGT